MGEDRLPELGKIPPAFFDRVIYPRLGAKDSDVVLGPKHGVDYGVMKVGAKYLALSTDPFFIVPSLGFARAAWFAFHIIVSDVAVSGLTPRYLAIDLNLPPSICEKDLAALWMTVHAEARRRGIAIVTGHTARYSGCDYPMVGGATAIAIGTRRELRAPSLVRTGDRVVITKGPAIETTGLLAALFPDKFIRAGGPRFQKEAASVFDQMSVLDDCVVARRFPGVHVMHDATECGVWGGLYEMARAGGYGLRVEEDLIPVQPVVRRTAEVFGFDPFCAISEGTLLAMVSAGQSERLVAAFKRRGIPSAVCGEVVPRGRGLKVLKGGRARDLVHPETDPYWALVAELSR
jgi:hydrogenase maturation factor